MKRVVIIGSPGVGKSTFARKLAAKTGLPLIHLDYFYHSEEAFYEKNKDVWTKKVMDLTKGEAWIIDGNYGRTMAERMAVADTIFYFDLPRRKAMQGIVRRRLSRTKRLDMPDSWKEELGPGFVKYVWTFRKAHAAGTRSLLEQQQAKDIIVFKSHKQSESYLAGLKS